MEPSKTFCLVTGPLKWRHSTLDSNLWNCESKQLSFLLPFAKKKKKVKRNYSWRCGIFHMGGYNRKAPPMQISLEPESASTDIGFLSIPEKNLLFFCLLLAKYACMHRYNSLILVHLALSLSQTKCFPFPCVLLCCRSL